MTHTTMVSEGRRRPPRPLKRRALNGKDDHWFPLWLTGRLIIRNECHTQDQTRAGQSRQIGRGGPKRERDRTLSWRKRERLSGVWIVCIVWVLARARLSWLPFVRATIQRKSSIFQHTHTSPNNQLSVPLYCAKHYSLPIISSLPPPPPLMLMVVSNLLRLCGFWWYTTAQMLERGPIHRVSSCCWWSPSPSSSSCDLIDIHRERENGLFSSSTKMATAATTTNWR